jgi:ABC-type sugar transport system permease subunit
MLSASARRRLKPVLLLLPSLIFLGAFTYWPVASVAVDSLYGRRLGEKVASFSTEPVGYADPAAVYPGGIAKERGAMPDWWSRHISR